MIIFFSVWNLGFFSLYEMLTVHPRFVCQSLHQNQLSRREKSLKVKNLPVKTKRVWGWQALSSWEKESQTQGAGSRWGFRFYSSTQLSFSLALGLSLGWARRNRAEKEPRTLHKLQELADACWIPVFLTGTWVSGSPGHRCQEGSAWPAPNLAPPSAGSGPELTEFLSAHRVPVSTSEGSLAQAFPKSSAAEGGHGTWGPRQLPEQAPHAGNTAAAPAGREAAQILHYTAGAWAPKKGEGFAVTIYQSQCLEKERSAFLKPRVPEPPQSLNSVYAVFAMNTTGLWVTPCMYHCSLCSCRAKPCIWMQIVISQLFHLPLWTPVFAW